jgi:hypothetical protein
METAQVISFDDKFTKNFIGTGLFVEDQEVGDKNYLKKIESKKILSQVEKAGLLSLAEKVSRLIANYRRPPLGSLGSRESLTAQAVCNSTNHLHISSKTTAAYAASHHAERRGRPLGRRKLPPEQRACQPAH